MTLDKDQSKGIQELFQQVLSKNQTAGDSARRLSSVLAESTLQYRDELYTEKGIVVTVEDVRKSLDWLLPALSTGNIPQLGNEIQDGLLRRWISQLTGIERERPREPKDK